MRWLKRRQFKSKDPEIREETLCLLSAKAGAKDIRVFAEGLLDENMNVRRAATKAIALIPPSVVPECVDALVPLLQSTDFSLRKSAALALQSLGWNPKTPEQQALFLIALGNFESIPADEGTVEPLLNALKIGPLPVQVGAAQALENIQSHIQDPRIIGPLIDTLKNSEPNLRTTVLRALGSCADEKRIPPLLKAFKDPAPLVRIAAIEAIGKTGNPEYLKYFLPLLNDESFEVREAAVTELARIKTPEALDLIISALRDRDSDVRKRAVESLGKLRDPRSAGALISTLIDPESIVRHAAANVLQIINCNWRTSKEAQEAVPRLEAGLSNPEYWVREAAAKALSRIRNS